MENKGDSSTNPSNKSLPSVLTNPDPSAVPQNTNDEVIDGRNSPSFVPITDFCVDLRDGEVVYKKINEVNPSIDDDEDEDEKKQMEKEGAVAEEKSEEKEQDADADADEVKKDAVEASAAAEAHVINNNNFVRYVSDYDLNQLPPEAAEFED